MSEHYDIWVCVDCYFAHHYGAHEHDGQWFAGESDTPADREPLALLSTVAKYVSPWADVTDNTDSETGEGIDPFSSSACEGCGSPLGGARYRLAVWPKELEEA